MCGLRTTDLAANLFIYIASNILVQLVSNILDDVTIDVFVISTDLNPHLSY